MPHPNDSLAKLNALAQLYHSMTAPQQQEQQRQQELALHYMGLQQQGKNEDSQRALQQMGLQQQGKNEDSQRALQQMEIEEMRRTREDSIAAKREQSQLQKQYHDEQVAERNREHVMDLYGRTGNEFFLPEEDRARLDQGKIQQQMPRLEVLVGTADKSLKKKDLYKTQMDAARAEMPQAFNAYPWAEHYSQFGNAPKVQSPQVPWNPEASGAQAKEALSTWLNSFAQGAADFPAAVANKTVVPTSQFLHGFVGTPELPKAVPVSESLKQLSQKRKKETKEKKPSLADYFQPLLAY